MNFRNFLSCLITCLLIATSARGQTDLVTLDPDPGTDPLNTPWSGGDWNTDGNFGGWTTGNITGATVAGGVLSGTASSTDPAISLTGITGGPDFDLGYNDFLDLRLKLPVDYAGEVKIYYGVVNGGYADGDPGPRNLTGFDASRCFTIPNANLAKDGATHVYRVNLSLEIWCRGQLNDLRIVPATISGTAFEIDYVRIGDTGPTLGIKDYDSASAPFTFQSKNFIFGWNQASIDFVGMNEAWAKLNLRNAEEMYAHNVYRLNYPRPRWQEAGGPYKLNFYCTYGGNYSNTWTWLSVSYYQLRTDPPTWTTQHELTHAFQGRLSSGNVPGDYYEMHANYGVELWLEHYQQLFPGQSDFQPAILSQMHFNNPIGSNYYETWQFMFYLENNPENLPGLGLGTVRDIWQQMQAGETIHQTLKRIRPSLSIKDLIGYYARRGVNYNYPGHEQFKTNVPTIVEWDQLTEPIRRPDAPDWWQPPQHRAPMQTGFTIHELTPSGAGAGRVVSVELKGLLEEGGEADWRASFVVVDDNGQERLNPLFGNNQTGSVTLAANENKVYLVVAATPENYELYRFDEPAYPYRSAPSKRRFHYEFRITGATPRERNNGATTGLVQHANGGGWKASTANVASTAYIGPNARVLNTAQVLGNARVEDYAVVRNNARLQDNAIARGHAQVFDNAVMSGRTSVSDFARLGGSATLSVSARLLEYATLTGGAVTDQSVMKGSSGSWGGTFSGNSIAEGDYGFSRNIHNASIAGHLPWVGIPDNWLVPIPTGLFASYEFSSASDGVAFDTYAATNGIYRGTPAWLSVDGARSGVLVLNGADQWVQLERPVADLHDLSLTTWVKWNGGTANQTLFQFGDGGSKFVTLTPSNGSGVAELRASDGTNTYSIPAANALPVGTWCQVAVSLDGTTGKFSINGTAAGSGSLPLRPYQFLPPNTATNPAHHFIGRGTAGNFFNGSFDDFKVYSVATPTFLLVSVEVPERIVPENAPSAVFRISRTSLTGSSTSGNLSVSYAISGTASAGADYVAPSGTVVIPDGQSFVDLEIPLILDDVVEADETIILSLAASNDYANVGSGNATVTIPNVGDISDSMLAWYKFDETSGTTANDSSGKGNAASLTGGATWNTVEQALSFDGATGYVQTPVGNGATRTLSAWIRPHNAAAWVSDANVFNAHLAGQWGTGWGVRNGQIFVMLDDMSYDSGVAISSNVWQHVVFTFDGTQARIYVNGQLRHTHSYAQGGVTAATYRIGRSSNNDFQNVFFDGDIRDAKILDRVVYSAEAMEIYQAGAPQSAPLNLTALADHGTITLGWQSANAGETGYLVRRSTVSGGPYTEIATVTTTSFVDASVANGTTYYYVVAGVNMGSPGPDSNEASATPAAGSALPPPWQHGYINPSNGAISAGASTLFSGGQVTVSGGGLRMASGNNTPTDSFRFVYIPVVGDCTITSRLVSLSGTNTARRAGVMIRETLATGSRHASTLITTTTNSSRSFVRRLSTDGNASANGVNNTHQWLRIVRSGTTFSSFSSPDGATWTQINNSQTISMSTSGVYYVGLAVCSGSTSVDCTAVFSNVTITGGFPTGLTATAGESQVSLAWNAVSGATSYRVKRATTPSGPYTLVASPTTNSFIDTTAVNGTTYYYVVSAHNGSNESANSAEVFATPVLLRTELVWNNSAGTGLWSSTDSNWTGFPWVANLDATIAHTSVAQTILLAESASADEVVIGKSTNNANYTLQGTAGATLSAAAMTVQGNANNDPGLGVAALNNLNAQIATDLRVGRWDLVIGGSSAVNIAGELRSTSDGSGAGDWGRVTLQDSASVTATGGVNSAGAVWGLTLNGGTLTTPSIRATENAYGAGARLTLNGSILRATQSTGTFLTVDSSNRAYVGSNGARFDTNGNDISVGVQLVDTAGQVGALTKIGDGMLTITAANTFTGPVVVDGGMLYANPGNAATNRAFSYASGITVNNGGTLRSGTNGLFGWDGSQAKPITINAGGTATTDAAGDVNVGLVTLNGGTLAGGPSAAWGSWSFGRAAARQLAVAENSIVSATDVALFGGSTVDVAAGKTLSFTGTIVNTSNGASALIKTGPGTIQLSGNNTYTGATIVRGGTLDVIGSIAAGGDLVVADAGVGALLSNAGTLNRNVFFLGTATNSVGGLTQSTGSTTATFLHLGLTPGSYGALKVDGGTFAINGDANVGSWGSGYQTGGGLGGLVEISSGTVNVTGWITMSRWGATQDAVLHVSGGNLTYGGGGLVGNWNADGADTSVITVSGNGSIATTNNTVINLSNNTSATNTGILNLNGGTVTPARVIGGRGFVHFNGGTLRAYSDQTDFLAVNSAFVHSGGAVIDSNDKAITIGQTLLAPTGSGVSSIAVTDGGSGYTCAPVVKINGGTFSVPATAVANMVDDGTGQGTFKIASLTITSPGVYTDAPTSVALIGGGSATPATFGSAVMAANASGSLTKNGGGTLTLTANNTYTGGTLVNAGTLSLTGTVATLGSGNLTVGNGAICAIANPNGAVANSASVDLIGTAKLDLAAGVNETVRFLYLNGVLQPAGTYTAGSLPAYLTGSGSLVVTEGVVLLTPAEIWRDLHFDTTANAGDAADDSDPDTDGYANLLERAFGLNPLGQDPVGRPFIDPVGPDFVLVFQHSKAASDLTLVVEVSSDLNPATWQPAVLAPAANADGAMQVIDEPESDVRVHRFTASSVADRRFYRIRVDQ